jgi:hypothetical protein
MVSRSRKEPLRLIGLREKRKKDQHVDSTQRAAIIRSMRRHQTVRVPNPTHTHAAAAGLGAPAAAVALEVEVEVEGEVARLKVSRCPKWASKGHSPLPSLCLLVPPRHVPVTPPARAPPFWKRRVPLSRVSKRRQSSTHTTQDTPNTSDAPTGHTQREE